jgi:hypothetical protein
VVQSSRLEDPAVWMSHDELAQAHKIRADINDEAATMSTSDLTRCLDAEREHRVKMFCWTHAGCIRWQAEEARGEHPVGLARAVEEISCSLAQQSHKQGANNG